MKLNKRKILTTAVIFLAGAAVGGVLILRTQDPNVEKKPKAPDAYEICDQKIPALNVEQIPHVHKIKNQVQGPVNEEEELAKALNPPKYTKPSSEEASDKKDKEDKNDKKDKKDGDSSEKEEDKKDDKCMPRAYHYLEVPEPHAAMEEYVTLLTDEEHGFLAVNEELYKVKVPSIYRAADDVYLAKEIGAQAQGETQDEAQGENEGSHGQSQESGQVLRLHLQWKEDECAVTVSIEQGEIKKELHPMTSIEAVDYIRSLPPSKLGLPGDTMQDYFVYALDGGVLVNGEPCIRMNVYSRSGAAGTNEVAGCYYLSSIKKKIYQQDMQTGAVVEVKPRSVEQPPVDK